MTRTFRHNLLGQAPVEAVGPISEQLVTRVKASLERRTAREAEFEGEGAWDEEDSELLEEQIAPEEVCSSCAMAVQRRRTRGCSILC